MGVSLPPWGLCSRSAARKRLPRRDVAIAAIVTVSDRGAAASLGAWIRDLPSDGRQEAVSELGHV